MEGRKFRIRTGVITGLLMGCIVWFVMTLYTAQIVHGAEYLEESRRKIVKTETVEASRGEITDRYGRVLITNRLSYNLTFDASYLTEGQDQNAAILKLIDTCDEKGVSHIDTLPVSQTAPFGYTLDTATDSQKNRFSRYLANRGWSSDTVSASDLLALMRKDFKLDESYTDEQAREIIGVRYELALRKLINTTAYVFAEDVDIDLISILKEGSYPGMQIKTVSAREYMTPYAAHLLGSVGQIYEEEAEEYIQKGYAMDEMVGKSGVEKAFEDFLRGTDGTRIIDTNTDGKITSELYTAEPQPGGNVALTIDIKLQEATEKALAETTEKMTKEDGEIRGGAAVVMDVNSGDVLASASYPTYSLTTYNADYNQLLADPANPLLNRAAQGIYPPGSTFKMVTAVGALEEGIITPSTIIEDKGIYTYYSDYQPRCWLYRASGRTHGKINVVTALEVSCNYFFYDIGRRLGIDKLDEYAQKFGLGLPTGIEIPESTGILASPAYKEANGDVFSPGDTLRAAIGQDNAFTTLQLANYVATLANGGTHYDAHLLKSVKSYDYSQLLYEYTPQAAGTVEISDSNLAAVKQGMRNVATQGTAATYLKNYPIAVGAKTGTAQTGADNISNGVFVCFAPYDDPQIAIAIVVEQGGSGSALAETAVAIMNAYFNSEDTMTAAEQESVLLP
ncbi:penicillin-binding transpeptidase domain-containing protein [Papillibacter cinnamivorans]|uniref:Penicillin-binding protein 2 n=1 Tax=Papillibacter cinnamivorans DSM 12816 TaxID=1122930 RepID=A0A1W2A825_9FIRM|nr:penicillin-binding transpeptidase domain-containing protein [Papillibacter cinnamivorans]SMC56814.1 penicillin-binding protein 2 [Papillibacter cinnamivorans DSM 12816]